MNSYAFNNIAGGNLKVACNLIWTEEMLAAGLLGVGAIAVISAIGWILNAYLGTNAGGDPPEPGDKDYVHAVTSLAWLLRVMVYGLAIAAVYSLSVTANSYLTAWSSWSDQRAPRWLAWPAHYYWSLFLATILSLEIIFRKIDTRLKSFTIAIFGSVGYAIVTVILVAWTADRPQAFWESPSYATAIAATLFALLMPFPVLVALVHAVPRLPKPTGPDEFSYVETIGDQRVVEVIKSPAGADGDVGEVEQRRSAPIA
jgi:hypothetical protein